MRHEFGFCAGPCAGFVTRAGVPAAGGDGDGVPRGADDPADRSCGRGNAGGGGQARFEVAARWRERFEQLEWLLAATSRARCARDLLTFVYRDPGDFGDDRVYLVRQGVVRASFPYPATPIEREAFRAVVADGGGQPAPPSGPLPLESIDEILLLMSWFRAHPEALRRTTPCERLGDGEQPQTPNVRP